MEGRRKLHPTCNMLSLTITAKLVAFFDMAFGLFGLVWFVLMLSRYDIISLDPFDNIASKNDTADAKLAQLASETHSKPGFAVNHKVISLTLVAFYSMVNLSVFVLLIIGIYKRSPGICLVWFYIRCAIFVFKLIIFIMYLIGGRPLFSQIPFLISMLVHAYGLWVVNSYVEELRTGRYEEHVQEVKDAQAAREKEPVDDFDVPNGIEEIQRQRLRQGLVNPSFENQDDFIIKEKKVLPHSQDN